MNLISEAESISSIDVKEFADVNVDSGTLSLTAVWEYILRRKELPDDLNLELFLEKVHERLRNVEWVVRQHALRLLKDVIPLLDKELIDEKLKAIIEDVVVNLGHIGPAVKKGAVDCLRCYVRNSYNADIFIENLVSKGLRNAQENKIPTNVVLGIVLSLPFLLSARVSDATLKHSIHRLLDKIVQVENQEVIVKALVRIRCLVGETRFNRILTTHETCNSIENFELLCKVYNIDLADMTVYSSSPVVYNDMNQNFVTNFGVWNSDTEISGYMPDIDEDKVILETEIKLDSGPAITMKIHEESRRNSLNHTDSEEDRPNTTTFKVLPDDNDLDNYEHLRRTPRRVRFGGEIIKVRTPDSDSNVQSDDDAVRSGKPLLEIHVVENEIKTTTRISRIPIPVRSNSVQSAPNSPTRDVTIRRRKLYKSSPNLSRSRKTYIESRIPRRYQTETKHTFERKIHIKINEQNNNTIDGKNNENVSTIKTVSYLDMPKENIRPKKRSAKTAYQTQEVILPFLNTQIPTTTNKPLDEKRSRSNSPKELPVHPMPRRNSRDGEFSPIPIHNEIEVIHNLARTPSPSAPETTPSLEPERQLSTADKILLPIALRYEPSARNVKTADSGNYTSANGGVNKDTEASVLQEKNNNQSAEKRESFASNFNSFQVYRSTETVESKPFSADVSDSPIPTKDSGECLTCSSSGSDTAPSDAIKLDTIGMLDNRIVEDIQCIDDVRMRQRGLEELMRYLQSPVVCESLEERLSTLLHILFTAEQQSILQPTAEQALIILFGNMRSEALTARLQQIALGLSKMGSPAGVRLALVIMKRISPKDLMDQLLSDNILGAKSSKVREGALQIVMTISRIFPSTETNLPKCINGAVNALKDKKRRVRQAALETVASLAQLSSTTQVMDIVSKLLEQQDEFDQIVKVVRNRLSRKQLPMVDMNGSIRYSTPSGDSELEYLQKGTTISLPDQRLTSSLPKRRPSSNWQRNVASVEDLPTASNDRTVVGSAQSQQVTSLPLVQVDPPSDRISGNWGSGRRFKSYSTEHLAGGSRIVGGYDDLTPRWDPLGGGDRPNFWRYNTRKQMEVQRVGGGEMEESEQVGLTRNIDEDPSSLPPTGRTTGSGNNTNSGSATATQIWAIDPTIFGAADRASAANGKFRPVYLVKSTQPPPRSKQYSRATNTSSSTNNSPQATTYSQRGRSFSPPRKQRNSSSSYEIQTQTFQQVPERFVRTSDSSYGSAHHPPYSIRDEGFHKSYSIDNLSAEFERERVRIRERNRGKSEGFVTSSGSSNESGPRYPGYWGKDVRSGIPVPISSDNLRIRRNKGSKKGPMTVPYLREKAVSPNENTDNLIAAQRVISRQPYSSGSDSSGYFTPPAESHLPEVPPEPPEVALEEPERFIKLESTFQDEVVTSAEEESNVEEKDAEEITHTFDKLEIEDHDNDVDSREDYEEEKFNDIMDTNGIVAKDEPSFVEVDGSFDEVDFGEPVTFSENRTLSKSEIDIARYSADVSRKNISSAPALNDFDDTPITPAKILLPGEISDEAESPKYITSIPSEATKPATAERLPPKSSIATLNRRLSCRVPRREPTLFPDTLTPFSKPKDAFAEVVAQLESPEWEITVKGLQGMVRLVRFHKEIIEGQMHAVAMLIGKQIRNLRSQVSRAACLVTSEIFANCRRGVETNLDDFAGPLLHRTADTNKFLRTDANAALDAMCVHLPAPRVVQVVGQRGAQHQNAVVRCASMRLLCAIVHRIGPERVFQLPKDTRDRIMSTGAHMLMEGNLESRKHAKVMLSLLSSHNQFPRALQEAVPQNVLRHIDKTIRSLT